MEPTGSVLPKLTELSPHQLAFLDEHLRSREDLSAVPGLSAELSRSCSDLDDSLVSLRRHLIKLAVSWIYRSIGAKSSIQKLSFKLENLSLCSFQNVTESKRVQKIFGVELPQLAREVQHIENIRKYVETALQLERFVGDLEDAVFSVINRQNSGVLSPKLTSSSVPMEASAKQDKLFQSIKVMNSIEDMLIEVLKSHPQWHHLLRCVDARVDKTLAVLRPKVIADHRALLASLGWPPKLVTTNAEGREISSVPNPLVLMQGEKRKRYSYSFLALCALQHLQTRREDRKRNCLEQKEERISRLWAIDELVSPIAARVEYHLSKWAHQPEFMFALVFRITKDFIIGVEDVLQPLIDEARLVSFSAREAWVFSMVQLLSEFLKNTFSSLAENYSNKDIKSEVSSSWLHLIDLIVAFDKRMQSLLNLEACLYTDHETLPGLLRGMSILSIFCDNPGWLKIWARVEFKDAWRKLKSELKDERAWAVHRKPETGNQSGSGSSEDYLLATREDHKAPLVTDSVLKIAWGMIDRCQTLPNTLIRVQFIRSTSGKFLWHFLNVLISHCQISALHSDGWDYNDNSIMRVCGSINTARYLECKLQEWSDDVNILDLSVAENDSKLDKKNVGADSICFFAEEIKGLAEIETNWLLEIIALLLRQFDTLSWEYVNRRERFEMGQEINPEADSNVSPDLLGALHALRSQLDVTRTSLNSKDFLDLWLSTADGLDHFFFCSILMSDVRFSNQGTSRFRADMRALYSVFQLYCARPEAFFPCIRNSLKLLNMSTEELKRLEAVLSTGNRETSYRQVFGISHLSTEQILKIIRKRML
ncbi:RINT1-like protein MAG2L [Punica granatum]|uniref:RINT1-like protein MAG2L n=1 Tax=Punica granatum TaxID=22663 RepID=A0A6P8E3L7_PUNGR|nr:RINT1-like protein MAG2L [Punica granatum]